MTGRLLFVCLLCVFVVLSICFVGATNVAYAEEIAPAPVGEDLGEWQAAVEYHAYTLSGNGLYYAFVVTFDNDFFLSSGTTENNVFAPSSAFNDLAALFTKAGYVVTKDGKTDGKLKASITYEDTVDYYIDNGMTGYDVNVRSGEETKTFFFTDYTRRSATPFSSITREGSLLNRVLAVLTTAGAQEDGIRLTYVYGTPYKIVRTDADRVRYAESSSLYLHSFDMTVESSDRTMTISQRSPNPTGWYVVAIFVGAIVIAVPLTILIIRKKHGGTYAR